MLFVKLFSLNVLASVIQLNYTNQLSKWQTRLVNHYKRRFQAILMDSASSLPGNWVIETLAQSSQIDVSLLLDLLEKFPQTSDNLGRNARELVSFRILERFLFQGSRSDSLTSSSPKVAFDQSKSCEDVLKRILLEMPASSLKTASPDMSKWDVRAFIALKRSTFGKPALQQLKDAILTGSYSSLASIKEQSGLPFVDQPEGKFLQNGGKHDDTMHKIEGTDSRSSKDNGQLIAPAASNNSFPVDSEKPDGNPSLDKQKRRSITKISRGEFGKDHITSKDGEGRKELSEESENEIIHCEQHLVGKVSTSVVNRHLEDTSVMIGQYSGTERYSLETSTNFRGAGKDGHPEDENNECPYLGDIGGNEVFHSKDQASHKIIHHEEQGGNHNIERNREDGNTSYGESFLEPKTSSGCKDGFEQEIHKNVTDLGDAKDVVNGDSDDCLDERTNIETKKNAFLSSQCSFSQGSVDCRDLNVCVKCKKGGKLLVCSANSCRLVVHKSCLGSHASFDRKGGFQCPFCAYSQAISEYMDIKEKVSLYRKDFATFVCLGDNKELKKQPHRSNKSKQHHLEHGDGLNRSSELNNQGIAGHINNHKHKRKLEYEGKGCSTLSSGDNSSSGGKAVDSTNGKAHLSKRYKREMKTMRRSEGENAHGKDLGKNHGSKIHVISRAKNRVLRSPETHIVSEGKSSPHSESADHQERSEENDDSRAPGYSLRIQKQKMQYTYPDIPQFRRMKVPWTTAEEEKLKEGIRIHCPGERLIPWTKIMEFGAGVFLSGRSRVDLKDKWRNICKASR